MFGLSWERFFRAVIAGFAATFVMEMAGFWQHGLGLARIDGAKFLADNARRHWVYGEFAHYMNGMALAVVYVRWLGRWLPGPSFVKGFLFGILNGIVADGITTPIIEPSVGPFFMNTPRPSRLGSASLIDHIIFGIAVSLGCQPPEKESCTEDCPNC